MVPDRLSYTEMYLDIFKYPSAWTQSYEAFSQHKHKISDFIVYMMENYKLHLPKLEKQKQVLHDNFFSATEILRYFK
jgi:hypothetical protein